MINLDVLNDIIIGRVDPHIYVFSTETVPNYLKVGDTYRPVSVRLKEWGAHYSNIKHLDDAVARTEDGLFFRDHSVHDFLINDRHRERSTREALKDVYFSKEFFKDATIEDFRDAIDDIRNSRASGENRYKFYTIDEIIHKSVEEETIDRVQTFEPRDNQQQAIDAFKEAVLKGKNNLLMYAVMRFGKSFTSMCCATEMKAKLVVVVSGKADVRTEWRTTVLSHQRFDGYNFIDGHSLMADHNAVTKSLKKGNVVLFLTLQDIQGEDIKDKHLEIFGQEIDLLIIDETHFGARAEQFGRALNNIDPQEYKQQIKELKKDGELIEGVEEELKSLNAKVKLHLSGTPYRILMGSEFTKDSIISFCQFTDIIDAQEQWDNENFERCENEEVNPDTGRPYKEWDNPYYGFPKMVRFAFNPNKSAMEKMESLRRNNISYAFSALLRPLSTYMDKISYTHRKFEYEREVLDLLEVIDGSKEDDNLLGFLDYDKIKEGKMCRHIVFVLPYCASCDALAVLIKNNIKRFKNLNEYEIINIAGLDSPRTYNAISNIKRKIEECEANDKKTITLTVNRMLTGATVKEWDTMIFLKDTASPQEYDQAIFRLQNPYIRSYTNEQGDVIKYNMKPQTLLVDFAPNRMFYMQEQKSLIYNVNTEANGNRNLEYRVDRELKISPIIVVNNDKINEITATDLLSQIINYSKNRSVLDEAQEVPIDFDLLRHNELREEINSQIMISAKGGFATKVAEGEGDDLDVDEVNDSEGGDGKLPVPSNQTKEEKEKSNEEIWREKFARYYSRMLFFAFLSKRTIKSVEDIIETLELESDDDIRIAKNLSIKLNIVTYFRKMSPLALNKLDNTLARLNMLSEDTSLEPIQRVANAMSRFGRISEAEVTTPAKVANDMVALLPEDYVTSTTRFLDIAAKQGEFAVAILERFGESVKDNIYSLPTSSVAYEFTRKVYDAMGLPIENIISEYTSGDVIKEDNLEIKAKIIDMKFDVVVGNPPYNETIGTDDNNKSLSKQLFPHFILQSLGLASRYISLITPSRWFSANAQDRSFVRLREALKEDTHFSHIVNYPNTKELFADVMIAGGVNYFLYDKEHSGKVHFSECSGGKCDEIERPLFEENLDIVISTNKIISILYKVKNSDNFNPVNSMMTGRDAFGIQGKKENLHSITSNTKFKGAIEVRCAHEEIRYIKREAIEKNTQLIDVWKIFISKGNGGAGLLTDETPSAILGKPYIGTPMSACSDSLLPIGPVNSEAEAKNLQQYIMTKFFRFMVGVLKTSQNLYQNVYAFVPIQDFTKKWTDKDLYKKYNLTPDEITFIESTIKPME